MNDTKLKEYTNAAEVAAENVPQAVINSLADVLFEIFMNSTQDKTA